MRRRGAAAGKTLVRLAQRCQSAEELGEKIRTRYDRAHPNWRANREVDERIDKLLAEPTG